ncbi:MAG: threonine--tRNA ligase [SAR202 cluster bacterium]|nr:threonine--tRNA ligase [SAR202 cluster bacterium]|tara:strand:- start:3728 stop:5476 length:1749 start_codon:yes stop_codon:yes gene_type:complete
MINQELLDLRYRIRHSAAHVMADVVTKMFPEAKLAIGPPTEDGFYYDFLSEKPFTEEDLEAIESEMRKIIQDDHQFIYSEYDREELIELNRNEPLKLEVISGISQNEILSTFKHGDFEDLCAGPHVESTSKIVAFKLLNVAGAYWRGDESRPMLQRIYGTAFESEQALNDHLHQIEEAQKRDHRLLGKQLDLFSINDEIGSGLIIWHPKGSRVRNIFEDYWRLEHYQRGYDLVHTPNIGKSNLWNTSGHLEFFQENMFPEMESDGVEYYLKPMNCPFHIMYYRSNLRSYRDLPMKIGELGTVYRYERGGTLHGMMRVRGFTQDDAHIFCTQEQIESEIDQVLDLTFEMLSAFGFSEFSLNLSTKPDKAVGNEEQWEIAENSLKNTLNKRDLEFSIEEGGGAFYGPKIDVNIKDAIGRHWQCTTIQFDFNLPQRFGLTYIAEDGKEHQPYMVHRAIFGSLERFMGILIEHFGGAFPLWLSPIQVQIIPIADRHIEYAENIVHQLQSESIRVTIDSRSERMNSKIREAQINKIPYMLIMGDREIESGTVGVRLRSGEDLGPIEVSNLIDRIKNEVDTKYIDSKI